MRSTDLLRRNFMPAMLAAMETCWLYPWALLLGGWVQESTGRSLLTPAVIFILLMAARLATRNFMSRGLPIEQVRTDLVALGLFAAVIAVRVDYFPATPVLDLGWLTILVDDFANIVTRRSLSVFGAAFALFIWWRGIVQERDRADQDNVDESFRNGAVALVLLLLLTAIGGASAANTMQAQIRLYVVGYFFLGLTCISLARLDAIREQVRARGDNPLPFNRHWSGLGTSIVAVMLLVTLALAQIFSFDLLGALLAPVLNLAGMAIIALIYMIVVPLFNLVDWIGRAILPFIHFNQQMPQLQMPDNIEDLDKNQVPAGFPPELILWGKWAIVAIIAIIGIWLLARSIFRWQGLNSADEADEERDSIWDSTSFWAAIKEWLGSLWRRLFPQEVHQVDATPVQAIRRQASSPLVLTIREIYRQLLVFGARVGAPRSAGTTPYEHLSRLKEHLEPAEDLAAITEAYVRTRYGRGEPSEDDARQVREHWGRIKEPAEVQN